MRRLLATIATALAIIGVLAITAPADRASALGFRDRAPSRWGFPCGPCGPFSSPYDLDLHPRSPGVRSRPGKPACGMGGGGGRVCSHTYRRSARSGLALGSSSATRATYPSRLFTFESTFDRGGPRPTTGGVTSSSRSPTRPKASRSQHPSSEDFDSHRITLTSSVTVWTSARTPAGSTGPWVQDNPLYKIRGLLRHGVEHLTERQQAKISNCLDAGDPTHEVNVAWQCYQQLRSIYHAVPANGREIAARSSRASPPARSSKSPGSAGPSAPGETRYLPTSTPQGPPTGDPPKPST
jgi:hypothetical protein